MCARQRSSLEPILVPVVEDAEEYAGPLPALVAGIRAAGTTRVVAVACDMPFLNVPLLADLAARLDEDIDAVVPVTEDGPQPLHAAYGDCAVEPLLAALAAGERSLRGALGRLRVRWVEEEVWRGFDPSGRSFRNVNTPEELAEAAALRPDDEAPDHRWLRSRRYRPPHLGHGPVQLPLHLLHAG